ncbi:hypothetical protein NC653_000903 [Populus alba x Populus x berolinensis]|uniref:Uncharacterized protein n=1 Tax=Populus alba x Populus x berolinensis TaxID=444605 RepID=A0AAD6RLJ1_9ROSI|nr:hypothetical protein NC653_000903 [Populus alba x Populus x berolinensis]
MFLSTSVHGTELFPLKVVFLLKLSFLDLVFSSIHICFCSNAPPLVFQSHHDC